MSIICYFWGCDWEKVKCVTEKFVIDNLLEDEFVKYARKELRIRIQSWRSFIPDDYERHVTQKVCLRCCKVQDNIQEYLDSCRVLGHEKIKEEQQKIQRKEKAEDMIKNCAKDKLIKIRKRRN